MSDLRNHDPAVAVNGDVSDPSDETPEVVRKAGLNSSVFNLTNTIIGGGILALPFALKQAGFALGVIFIIFEALLVVLSGRLLVKTSKIINPDGGGISFI